MNFDNKHIAISIISAYNRKIEKLHNQINNNKPIMDNLVKTLDEHKKDIEFKNKYINELKNEITQNHLEIFKLNEKILELSKTIEFFKNKTYKRTIVFNDDGCVHDESINIDN